MWILMQGFENLAGFCGYFFSPQIAQIFANFNY